MKSFEQFKLVSVSDSFAIIHFLEEEKENPYSKEKMSVATEKRYPLATMEEVKCFYEQEIAPLVKTPKSSPIVDFDKLKELLSMDLTLSISISLDSITFSSFVDLLLTEETCGLLHITTTKDKVGLEEHLVNPRTISLSEVFKYPE